MRETLSDHDRFLLYKALWAWRTCAAFGDFCGGEYDTFQWAYSVAYDVYGPPLQCITPEGRNKLESVVSEIIK